MQKLPVRHINIDDYVLTNKNGGALERIVSIRLTDRNADYNAARFIQFASDDEITRAGDDLLSIGDLLDILPRLKPGDSSKSKRTPAY